MWGRNASRDGLLVVLDVPTLFAVTLFIAVIGGLLLLFSFQPER